jgi:hypothetical protein
MNSENTSSVPPEEASPEEASPEELEAPKATGKQLLAWVTGDRDREAEALAEQTAERTDLTKKDVLPASKIAVADAHGDSGVGAADEERSDVATPSDVTAVVEKTSNSSPD